METPPVVLVVEGHPELREVLIDALAWVGFEVLTAVGVDDAARVLHKRPVDLLVSDPSPTDPPGDGGAPLRGIQDEFPKLPMVVLADADDDTVYFRPWSTFGTRRTLRRPFRLSDFVAACREAVGARLTTQAATE